MRWRFPLGRCVAAFQAVAGLSLLGLAIEPALLVTAALLALPGARRG